MFDQFTNAVADASTWAYLILVAAAFLDALVPIVPSEASVITAGVVAADGDLSLALVLASAATGAFLGDNAVYALGRRYGPWAQRRLLSGERSQRRLDWARQQLAKRGGELIVVGRFVPGGRTAVALAAGTVRYSWRRFVRYDVIAAVIWASYAAFLGFFGGKVFETAPWKGLLVAFGTAALFATGGEVLRRVRRRWRGPAPHAEPAAIETPRAEADAHHGEPKDTTGRDR